MEDKDIVALYWERDERAIDETKTKYGHYCMSIAKNILSAREDAEECVNDGYLGTWNAIPPHRPKLLSVFVGKIVRNLAFNRYKMLHAVKRGGSETALILDELGDIVSDKADVEDEVTAKELISDINKFIASLPEESRYIFIRRYWYADSVKAIAERTGKSADAVSVMLGRIRNRLKDHLKERGCDL